MKSYSTSALRAVNEIHEPVIEKKTRIWRKNMEKMLLCWGSFKWCENVLHGVLVCVLVRHLPAALDDDEEQESSQSVSAFHFLSFWKRESMHVNKYYEAQKNKPQWWTPGRFKGGRCKDPHLCFSLLSVWMEDCKVRWLVRSRGPKLFHGPLYMCSVFYSGAEERSPSWLPPVTETSASLLLLSTH